MDVETKMALAKAEPFEEAITESDLRSLFETKEHPRHYNGLEISGMPHIGHLLVGGKKINDLNKAGVKTQILLADWHTIANGKFGGDWSKIIKAAGFYKRMFSIFCPETKVILGSDLYKGNDDYWKLIMSMSTKVTMARATRTLIIEGRSQKDTLHVSQYIYPIMQAADIHALGADIPHAGIDQRRVHVLAKELFKELKMETIVPLHHHLVPSMNSRLVFAEGESKEEKVADMKMSKSKPGSFISVVATDDEIRKIMSGAWCESRVVEGNPVLMLCRYIIMPIESKLMVERKREHGGDIEYNAYADIEADFRDGKLHPADLKSAAAEAISKIISPVRSELLRDSELIAMLKSAN
jgi:tyrosyl-tRNA synthetase